MKQQFIFLAILLGYWLAVGLVLMGAVKAWPWLAGSPWLFVIIAPFFVVGMIMRVIMRRKLSARGISKP